MPRDLALLLCLGLIYWLFRADFHLRRGTSKALIIPGLWLAIIGSRPLGYWIGTPGTLDAAAVEGNAINLVVQGGLMLSAMAVLHHRGFNWNTFFQNNKPLIIIYLYFLLSAIWSFYPVPTLKRITRDFGTVLMVLIILSDKNPYEAARIIFVRCAYVLFPLSVIFIKYYPELGRMYSMGWELMYTGVTTHKNSLGIIVFVFGLMILIDTLELRRVRNTARNSKNYWIRYGMLLMGVWLLVMSNSKTSLLCLVCGLLLYWVVPYLIRFKSTSKALSACIAALLVSAACESLFGISSVLFKVLGREENLTGRTDVWVMVLEQKTNPLIGCGFMSFWDSPMGQAYNEKHGTSLVSAHNGYLDIYLDGGSIGLLLLALLLLISGVRIMNYIISGDVFAKVKFMYFVTILIHNISESSYLRLGPLWFVFLLSCISCKCTSDCSSK